MFEGFPNEASNKDSIRNGSELSAQLGHDDQFETIIICREVFSCLKIELLELQKLVCDNFIFVQFS